MSGTLQVKYTRHSSDRVEVEVEDAPDETSAREAAELFVGMGEGVYEYGIMTVRITTECMGSELEDDEDDEWDEDFAEDGEDEDGGW